MPFTFVSRCNSEIENYHYCIKDAEKRLSEGKLFSQSDKKPYITYNQRKMQADGMNAKK